MPRNPEQARAVPEAGTGPETILRAEGLSKWYGGVRALHDVSLDVGAGEIVGLVGPNGAGKTTLVDILTGTQSSDGGHVELAGERLTGSAAKRAGMGLGRTFQHPLLPGDLSIVEAIVSGLVAGQFGRTLSIIGRLFAGMVTGPGSEYTAAAQLANEFGLLDVDRRCGDLSLGEQRLVEVVRAIAQDPTVMLLDEPFAGADPVGIAGTNAAIREVKARGHAVVLVDHNVDLVSDLADRIVLLDQGEVVFDGDPQECLVSDEMKAVYFGGSKHDA